MRGRPGVAGGLQCRDRASNAARSISLADRTGHWRSRSTVSSPFMKQQMSSATPESSGPIASTARLTARRAAIALSVKSAIPPRDPFTLPASRGSQEEVTRGCSWPRMKSATSRSPAAIASPGRNGTPGFSFSRASAASGDSV
jgi:hypothetical protein